MGWSYCKACGCEHPKDDRYCLARADWLDRCQCEHVNCHPNGDCQLPISVREIHFGIRQGLCHLCAGKEP